ncbi:MAG: hypothetical protein CSA50_05035 [Gammaproteobacteria bacterium]|nr:MAG: hypothetical protein CSA50_05035 [Gammaproteobacteria bacterium]
MFVGAGLLVLVLALPAFAQYQMENQHSLVLGSGQINFTVKMTAFDSIPLKLLDKTGFADAYLPGSFEPVSAGEVARIAQIR